MGLSESSPYSDPVTDLAPDQSNPLMQHFWTRDAPLIDADLADLRSLPPRFFPEAPTEGIGIPNGPGAWAVTQYDLITEMSRAPETFSSANGITILDTPKEFVGLVMMMP